MIKINTWCQKNATIGILKIGDFKCFTLELPWQGNESNVSCIKAGKYKARKYNSPSKGAVLLLEDVENRTYIEIHAGNYTRQILGCVLVGDSIKFLDNDDIPDVTNSKNTLSKLLDVCSDFEYVEISRVSAYDF